MMLTKEKEREKQDIDVWVSACLDLTLSIASIFFSIDI